VTAKLQIQPLGYAFLATLCVIAATFCTAAMANSFFAQQYLEAGVALLGLIAFLAALLALARLGQFIDYVDKEKLRYFYSSVIARDIVDIEE
jgi:hypothetical protein